MKEKRGEFYLPEQLSCVVIHTKFKNKTKLILPINFDRHSCCDTNGVGLAMASSSSFEPLLAPPYN